MSKPDATAVPTGPGLIRSSGTGRPWASSSEGGTDRLVAIKSGHSIPMDETQPNKIHEELHDDSILHRRLAPGRSPRGRGGFPRGRDSRRAARAGRGPRPPVAADGRGA